MADNNRRLERERSLSLLYEAEVKGESIDEVLESLPAPPEPFVIETVRGVAGSAADLDAVIAENMTNWAIDRVAVIDRMILRIGAWELINRGSLSVAVVVSEAVELAKRFSTEESGKFVNGVLDAAAGRIRS